MFQDFMIPETPEVKADEARNSFVIREPAFLLAVTWMGQEALKPPRGTRGQGEGGSSDSLIRKSKVVGVSSGSTITGVVEGAGARVRIIRDLITLLLSNVD